MRLAGFLAVAASLTLPVGAAWAQEANFFLGKQITMQIGSAAGGANDAYARLLARHMGRHIPGNPTVVAQNVVGAGSLVLANQLFNTPRRDGTIFGQLQRTLLLDPLLANKPFIIKPLEFNWLGSLNRETNVLIVAGSSPVKTLDDAKVHEIIMAAEGVETDGVVYPRLINRFLGTKFRVVPGYDGDANMMLAIDRGEVQGRGGVPWSAIKLTSADRLREGRIRVIAQLGMRKHAELPDVPMLLESVTRDIDRKVLETLFARQEMGRPFVLPPGVPVDRVEMLRAAFAAATKDPEFLKEASKLNFEIDLMDGREMQALMTTLYALPKNVVDEIRQVLQEAIGKN
jgi:tripartite-type tricarboxylate transporter receptor subunit TctC